MREGLRSDARRQAGRVLSNNDGCVIARTNESKALGIEMGAPAFKLRDLIKQHDVIVRSSNYELYGDMSARVMDCLSDFTDELETYSIDEAFLRLDVGAEESFTALGREIRCRVLKHTGIPVSVGLAKTKTLTKVANYHAKRSEKAAGVLSLERQTHTDLALERLPVDEVWGIGPRYTELLRRHGIETALDLRDAPHGDGIAGNALHPARHHSAQQETDHRLALVRLRDGEPRRASRRHRLLCGARRRE